MSEAIRKVSLFFIFVVSAVNLWVFARFTVDDAFITWRYGKNLIEHGIWAYNPFEFDLTQAYTNPIYALFSIIPASIGADPVLAFKVLSIVLLLAFLVQFLALVERNALTLSMLAIFVFAPKTLLHVFSGLETFLYVALTAFLFIALDRRAFGIATALTSILVLTRPEAWLLAALVPAFVFATTKQDRLKSAFRVLLPIVAVMGFYFAAHYFHFGEFLPNTYFAKTFSEFSHSDAVKLILALSPLIVLALLPGRQVFFLAYIHTVILVGKYLTSTLAMNYGDRFVFHVFGPLFLFTFYKLHRHISSARNSENETLSDIRPRGKNLILTLCLATSGFLAGYYYDAHNYLRFINYYPRLLSVHGEFGRALRDLTENGEVRGVAMGDAGIAAYHADLPNLDLLGLGSRMVTRNGIDPTLIGIYDPDVIVFYGAQDRILSRPTWHDALLEFAETEGFKGKCSLVYDYYHRLVVYSRVAHPEISALCAETERANRVQPTLYLARHIRRPPWEFWHD